MHLGGRQYSFMLGEISPLVQRSLRVFVMMCVTSLV